MKIQAGQGAPPQEKGDHAHSGLRYPRSNGILTALATFRIQLQELYCITAFLIGLFSTTTVNLVGAMPVGEILLVAVSLHALLVTACRRQLPSPLPAGRLLCFVAASQLIAILSYVISDLWRESSSIDMLRGWLRMIFLLIDIVALAIVLGCTIRSFIWLQTGMALSFCQLLIKPPLFHDYWKFGFAYPVTSLVLLLAPRFLGLWGAIAGLMTLGMIHFRMDSRSLGAECLALSLILMISSLPKSIRKLLVFAGTGISIVVCPVLFGRMFEPSASGRVNRSNVERSAMLQAGWEGFTSSPLLGQGSWFSKSPVIDNFLRIRAEKEEAAGGGLGFAHDDATGIAIHSQILVSLAEGGLLGGTFFLVYGILIWWAFCHAISEAPWHWTLPSRIFLLGGSFFNLWMSPFSGPARIGIAITVVIIALFWRDLRLNRTGLYRRSRSYPRERFLLA